MAAPVRIIRLEETDSTNDEVRRRAANGETPPFWVTARRQTAGRGRRGRAWSSLDGNLFASGLYRLACPPAEAAQLTFAASLAVAEMLERHAAPDRIAVKWPNDVLLDGRKIAGVLLESASAARGVELVVGCGVNLSRAPEDAERPAIALAEAMDGASPPQPTDFCDGLVARFEHWRGLWGVDGFEPVRSAWLSRAAGRGAAIEARLPDGVIAGIFEDIDRDGALILALSDGARRLVRAGEVFFPAPDEGS